MIIMPRFPNIREIHKIFMIVIPAPSYCFFSPVKFHLFHDEFEQIGWHFTIVNKPDRYSYFTLFEAEFHLFHETLRDIVVNIQLGIAGNFNGISLEMIVIENGENIIQTKPNNIVNQNDVLFISLLGQNQETRNRATRNPNQGISKFFRRF